jgi:hypothetical protein
LNLNIFLEVFCQGSGIKLIKDASSFARFAERGIANGKEFGNTNGTVVSDWVKTLTTIASEVV